MCLPRERGGGAEDGRPARLGGHFKGGALRRRAFAAGGTPRLAPGPSRCTPYGAARGRSGHAAEEAVGDRRTLCGSAGGRRRLREVPRARASWGLAAGTGSTGRGCSCGAMIIAVGLVFCRRPRPRLLRDRSAEGTLAASVV